MINSTKRKWTLEEIAEHSAYTSSLYKHLAELMLNKTEDNLILSKTEAEYLFAHTNYLDLIETVKTFFTRSEWEVFTREAFHAYTKKKSSERYYSLIYSLTVSSSSRSVPTDYADNYARRYFTARTYWKTETCDIIPNVRERLIYESREARVKYKGILVAIERNQINGLSSYQKQA